MIEKQLRKPLTKEELLKVEAIEVYPLYYIDNISPKKITYVVDLFVGGVDEIINGRRETISYDECLNNVNKIWHVGGTVILMYDKKLKGYKTKVPFKHLTKSVKKMI